MSEKRKLKRCKNCSSEDIAIGMEQGNMVLWCKDCGTVVKVPISETENPLRDFEEAFHALKNIWGIEE